MTTPTVDAHHHFWQRSRPFNYSWLDAPALAPIRRDFLPSDLEPLLKAEGINATVVVQTQHDLHENAWALGLADFYPFIAGVVGWVDLASADCERQLTDARNHPKFVGVRHVTQDEPDDGFLLRDDVVRGLKVLERQKVPFDLLIHVRHLAFVPTLAEHVPDLPLVINHLAKPEIKARRFAEWLPLFRAASRYPNVSCKLSGLVTEADWNDWESADLKPYVHAALDAFGFDRLMFGSDWPVCELAGTYAEVREALVDAIGPVSKAEHDAIFGGTAVRFYGLSV